MSTNIISDFPPSDGKQYDCQCARCGSSCDFQDCDNCGGDGLFGHDCGDDCCCCLHPVDNIACDFCDGNGGWWICLSSPDWCSGNPMRGREQQKRGTVEWFVDE